MAQYEIEVDSQDEYYEDSMMTDNNKVVKPILNGNNTNVVVQSAVVKRKGRGFSSEEPSTQVLGEIKHFDTIREEFSGKALRCKLALYTNHILILILISLFSCRRLGHFC